MAENHLLKNQYAWPGIEFVVGKMLFQENTFFTVVFDRQTNSPASKHVLLEEILIHWYVTLTNQLPKLFTGVVLQEYVPRVCSDTYNIVAKSPEALKMFLRGSKAVEWSCGGLFEGGQFSHNPTNRCLFCS